MTEKPNVSASTPERRQLRIAYNLFERALDVMLENPYADHNYTDRGNVVALAIMHWMKQYEDGILEKK